jgi:endoglucanase
VSLQLRATRVWLTAIVLVTLGFSVSSRAQSWPLWNAYQKAFVDPSGRVIDHAVNGRTTSEGQSYALFFSLVANKRAEFAKVLNWTQNNLARGSLSAHLPAWEWGKHANGNWSVLDPHSAADSDVWISYSLLQAGRLWHEPRYTAIGRLLAERIAHEEVADLPGFGPMLLPGAKGFQHGAENWLLNPSYVPLPVIESLAQADPSGPWRDMADHIAAFIKAASPSGFCLDWVSYSPPNGFAPSVLPGSSATSPQGSFDAIRVYLWAGITNPKTKGSNSVLHALWGMSNYLKHHILPPQSVTATGHVLQPDGPAGFSAAVAPYLDALGNKRALETQQSRLAAAVNPGNGLYGKPTHYYDQNLALFAEGWLQHRFGFSSNGNLWVEWNRK